MKTIIVMAVAVWIILSALSKMKKEMAERKQAQQEEQKKDF